MEFQAKYLNHMKIPILLYETLFPQESGISNLSVISNAYNDVYSEINFR